MIKDKKLTLNDPFPTNNHEEMGEFVQSLPIDDMGEVSASNLEASVDSARRVENVAKALHLSSEATEISKAVLLGTLEAGKVLRRS